MQKILSNEEISSLCLELSILRKSGVDTQEALSLLAQSSDPGHSALLEDMAWQMQSGAPRLSSAMRSTQQFPAYVCGLIEAGEETGRVTEALSALAGYYEERVRMDRRIRSALLYPAVMLVLMLVVIAVLLVKVLPIFDDVYASLGGRLTGVAGGLLAIGQWLDRAMPVLWVVMAAAVVFLIAFAAVGAFRDRVTGWWRKGHGDKGVSRMMNTARLAQALSMCMTTGKTLEEAVELAIPLMDDIPPARARCEDCRRRLQDGESTVEAMRGSGLLPAPQCRLLELGQKKGVRGETMERIAATLSEESEAALEDKVSRVEPALVLVCSVLVGLILLSVMLPLMHIMSAIG